MKMKFTIAWGSVYEPKEFDKRTFNTWREANSHATADSKWPPAKRKFFAIVNADTHTPAAGDCPVTEVADCEAHNA
jgi:hypothetical protein